MTSASSCAKGTYTLQVDPYHCEKGQVIVRVEISGIDNPTQSPLAQGALERIETAVGHYLNQYNLEKSGLEYLINQSAGQTCPSPRQVSVTEHLDSVVSASDYSTVKQSRPWEANLARLLSEREAFVAMLPDLLKTNESDYVAFYGRRLLCSGRNPHEVQRLARLHPEVSRELQQTGRRPPVLVAKCVPDAAQEVHGATRIPSPLDRSFGVVRRP